MIELGPNSYGKSQIRLVKVSRGAGRHTLRDLTVAIALEGDFEAAHTEGDNAKVVDASNGRSLINIPTDRLVPAATSLAPGSGVLLPSNDDTRTARGGQQ